MSGARGTGRCGGGGCNALASFFAGRTESRRGKRRRRKWGPDNSAPAPGPESADSLQPQQIGIQHGLEPKCPTIPAGQMMDVS